MTEKDLEIQRLRRMLKRALEDLNYVLLEHEVCEICKYFDADCSPDGGNCVPQWRGL